MNNSIKEHIDTILNSIIDAKRRYHRESEQVKLVAVSKLKTVQQIRLAIDAGVSHFGESYCQEAVRKIRSIPDSDLHWHFIGPIQSNKTAIIAKHFSWVHSIDRFKIAKRLSDTRINETPPINVLIQVNISEESSKSGVRLDELAKLAESIVELPKLRLRGLMTILAKTNDFDEQRRQFAKLRKAQQMLSQKGFQLDTLSMGMSNDYIAAIAEGATLLRIGTALFGPREEK